jgi:polyferredoxin
VNIESPEIARSTSENPSPLSAGNASAEKPRKKFIRRLQKDHSQLLRRSFQAAFLLLNGALGTLFYLWVRQFETQSSAAQPFARPAGVEGWLPIAGLMNLKYWILTAHVPKVHPAAMFLLLAFLSMAFLLRKAFCSWLCPVGTVSEYLWRAGRKIFGSNVRLPRWIDLPLRGLKYLLLAFFVWAISTMSAVGIQDFMQSPYGLIADVKMLNFFRHIGQSGLITLAVFVTASLFVKNFWCRFLCPYGALLGLVSLLSPARIKRDKEACVDCAKCVKACPASLPVDKLVQIRSVECTGCLECVAVCPSQNALSMTFPTVTTSGPSRPTLPPWAMAAAIATLFLGVAGFAKLTGHWQSSVPNATYQQLIPHADKAAHPVR